MAAKTLENLSLMILMALAAVRPIISERYDSAPSGFGVGVTGIADPSPLTTIVFDCLILVAAVLCFWARAIRNDRRYQWSGLELGAAFALVGGIVSCFFASNIRLAVNATIDWLCLPVATITLVQLLRSRRQRQLLVMFVLGSACVQVWQILDLRFAGLEDMWQRYLAGKESFWQHRGVPLDSPTVALFEHRIRANEAQGFFPHSNVASSYLVLCFFVALGLAVGLWQHVRRGASVVSASAMSLVGLAIFVAVGLTKSLGGFVSLGTGLVVLGILTKWHRWVDAHRRKVFAIGWTGFSVGVLAIVGHGTYHGSLPGASLNFRWQYWTASSNMIADHPWTGVGRENFGRNYLRYKSIKSSEEVANPHNLFVQAACDWGVAGLVGAVLMCVGATHAIARRKDRLRDKTSPARVTMTIGEVLPWAIGGLATMMVGRMFLLGSDDANWVYYQTVTAGLVWAMGFALVAAGFKSLGQTDCEDGGLNWKSFVSVGLLAFFLHEMINFALFVPGSAYSFFVLLACPLSAGFRRTQAETNNAGGVGRWGLVVAGVLALVTVAVVALVPVAMAGKHLRLARNAAGVIASDDLGQHPSAREYELAGIADPIDPTPHLERARWVMGALSIQSLRGRAIRLARESLLQAIQRDPLSVQLRRMRLRMDLLWARESDNLSRYDEAIDSARDVLELYPQSPLDIVALGDAELEAGRVTKRTQLARDAITSYRRALALDNQRPEWEVFQRLQPTQRDAIHAKINEARKLLTKPRASSAIETTSTRKQAPDDDLKKTGRRQRLEPSPPGDFSSKDIFFADSTSGYLQEPFFLQMPEQQSAPDEQGEFFPPQVAAHAGSALQSESLQSMAPSQSLSTPSLQVTSGFSVGVQAPAEPGTVAGAKIVVSLTSRRGSWMPSPESSTQLKLPVLINVLRMSAGLTKPLAARSAAAPEQCGADMLVPLRTAHPPSL